MEVTRYEVAINKYMEICPSISHSSMCTRSSDAKKKHNSDINSQVNCILLKSPIFSTRLKTTENIWHLIVKHVAWGSQGRARFKEVKTNMDAQKPKLSFLWLRSDQNSFWAPGIIIPERLNRLQYPRLPWSHANPWLIRVLLQALEYCRDLGWWIGPAHLKATVTLPRATGVACFMTSFYWANYRN